ncbi:MAG: anti-sigma regulatory factor [Candidatus Sericytochromatia bacterium]
MIEQPIPIRSQNDVLIARQTGRELARSLGFRLADQTRLATAISELTRNVIQYAGEGVCVVRNKSSASQSKIEVEVEDWGKGILNLDQAMTDGFSSGSGLGAGLPGTRRLMQEFRIETEPGHTKITIALVRPRLS